jgi:hypothetical protein
MFSFVLAFIVGTGDTLPPPPPRLQAAATERGADSLEASASRSLPEFGPASTLAIGPAFGPVFEPGEGNDSTPHRRRPKAIEYSDAYSTRMAIHKAASWATLPLFVGQYFTGEALMAQGTSAPDWVKRTHPILATGVLALFATNTVTGVWNLWEGREDPKGRAWRMAHSILMLASDGGFAYVGALSHSVKQSAAARNQHRAWALSSAGLSLVSYVMMLPPFRRE